MGLTGFNRQRKRALNEIIDDPALADKLVAHGINEPEKLKEASEEDLSFLTDEEIAKCRGEESTPIEELNVKPLKKKVSAAEDVEVLSEWLELEANNKDRKSAKEAIQKRIDELEEAEGPTEEEQALIERNEARHEKLEEAGAEFIGDPGIFVADDLEIDLQEVNSASDEDFEVMLEAVKVKKEEQDAEPEEDSEEPKESDPEEEPESEDGPDNEEEAGKEIESFEDIPADADFPFGYGGGMFYLSDGSKVRGEKAAEKAQQALEDNEE